MRAGAYVIAAAPATSFAGCSPLQSNATCLPTSVQGKVVRVVQSMAAWLGMGRQVAAVAAAPSLLEQRARWEALWVVRLLRAVPTWALSIIADFAALLFFNRVVLW